MSECEDSASVVGPTTPLSHVTSRMKITPLGAGNEVGRSCVLMTYKGKTVMFDCGIHPGYSGPKALPFFDAMHEASVDVLLVTHFHFDHCGSLTYFLEKVRIQPHRILLNLILKCTGK